jgi:hypothetical protein
MPSRISVRSRQPIARVAKASRTMRLGLDTPVAMAPDFYKKPASRGSQSEMPGK